MQILTVIRGGDKMKGVLCDHCKKQIPVKGKYFFMNISLLEYDRVYDELGYCLAEEHEFKGKTEVTLCNDCGEKFLHGCRW